MKSFILPLAVIFLLTACTTTTDPLLDTPVVPEQQFQSIALNLDFVTTEATWDEPSVNAPQRTTATTRATSATPPTRIALRIFHADGTPALDQINQTKDDTNFGKFSGLRLAPGNYKCVIVAHRASAIDKPSATITTLTQATLPETDLWDTYTTVYDLTVTSGSYATQEYTISIPLCVTRLSLTLLDAVPATADQIRLTLNSGASTTASAPITLNPTSGLATTDLAYTRTWTLTSGSIGQTNRNFVITGLMTAYPKTCDAKIEALSSDGTPIFTRTLQNLSFSRAKIRKVSTNLFTGSADLTLNFEDWTDEDETIVIP